MEKVWNKNIMEMPYKIIDLFDNKSIIFKFFLKIKKKFSNKSKINRIYVVLKI